MMTEPHSSLVLVFPEGDDENKTSAYLLSDKEYTPTELSVFIDTLGEIIHSFSHENHQFLLDARNRNNFYKLLENYNDKKDYPKVADAFLTTIANVNEIDSPSTMVENASFTINEAPISIDVFAEVASRKLSLSENTYALISSLDIINGTFVVNVTKDGNTQSADLDTICADMYAVYEWISNNRRPVRVYIPNPEKHGTENKGAQKYHGKARISQLKCSDKEAENLMHHALANKNGDNKLFVYDFDRKMYMQFDKGSGNVENNYHGFHVADEGNMVHGKKEVKLKKLTDKFKAIVEKHLVDEKQLKLQ